MSITYNTRGCQGADRLPLTRRLCKFIAFFLVILPIFMSCCGRGNCKKQESASEPRKKGVASDGVRCTRAPQIRSWLSFSLNCLRVELSVSISVWERCQILTAEWLHIRVISLKKKQFTQFFRYMVVNQEHRPARPKSPPQKAIFESLRDVRWQIYSC